MDGLIRDEKKPLEFGIFPVPPFCQDRMGSALQDRKTPEVDENNRKNRLETYSTIFLDSTGKKYARIEWVPPLKGAQPRISGFYFFAMIDWIPSEGHNPDLDNIYAFFFWQNVAIYALFRKISPFMRFFLAKCRDLRTFSSVPPKQSKLLSVPPLSFYQP